MIVPRPYQAEALEALDEHLMTKSNNPCVVIPTGGGKSILIAWAIANWKSKYEQLRVCILAHRKELVSQNFEELADLLPFASIGVYSAGLNQKDLESDIIYASIDSIFKKWGETRPFDVVIVDEAHRIPVKGDGKYRQFIDGCRIVSPNLRVVGFTATPYRMGSGMICHRDHVLNETCYSANVGDLINDGFLCKLRSKLGEAQPDLSSLKKSSTGDYIIKKLAEVVDKTDTVASAVQYVVKQLVSEKRKSTIFFCINIAHCEHVSEELARYGIHAPVVTSKTTDKDRDRIADDFKAGRISAICNMNVYTEGFNAKRVDCVVLLRPTLSRGLYIQMTGRGLRLHEEKDYCLVLDMANCIAEHGPIDCDEEEKVKLAKCADCGNMFSRAVRVCTFCGWEIPKIEIEREEAKEREARQHEIRASNLSILGSQPETINIDSVSIHRHVKQGKPDSIKVQYRAGLSTFREWVCLDHDGYAERKARRWWSIRFGEEEAREMSVNDALGDMFLGERIRSVTTSIVVVKKGKHFEITDYLLSSAAAINNIVN